MFVHVYPLTCCKGGVNNQNYDDKNTNDMLYYITHGHNLTFSRVVQTNEYTNLRMLNTKQPTLTMALKTACTRKAKKMTSFLRRAKRALQSVLDIKRSGTKDGKKTFLKEPFRCICISTIKSSSHLLLKICGHWITNCCIANCAGYLEIEQLLQSD